MTSNSSDGTKEFNVLRVTQLDTHELDSELLNQYKQLTEECFKYLRYKFISKYQNEINTAIKLVIWYFTYYKTNQTIGQSILNWSYKTKNQRFDFIYKIIFYCFDDYLQAKLEDKGSKVLLSVFKIFEFLNFLKFLYSGDYLHLWQRLFRFKPLYDKEQELREISSDYTERELIWQSYFLLIKLLNSVFNFKSLTISRLIRLRKKENSLSKQIEIDESKRCRLCDDVAITNAYFFKSCKFRHCYCYYCIRNYSSFSQNLCTLCGNENEIEPFFIE